MGSGAEDGSTSGKDEPKKSDLNNIVIKLEPIF